MHTSHVCNGRWPSCSGACKCGSRRTLAGGMVESAHGERARATVSMRPCSASCCVREAAWRGVFKVRKTFAFECGKTRGLTFTREFYARKFSEHPECAAPGVCVFTVRSNVAS